MRGLILDYGGVLTMPHEMGPMAARLGVPVEAFARAYMVDREALDTGVLPVDEYWDRFLSHLSVAHLASPSLIASLVEDDVASWSKLREETWTIAATFRASAGRTALLTNNIPPLMARLRASGRLAAHFDVVIASCEFGACKPAPTIFRACLEALGVDAKDTLFVDDHPPNVAGAAVLGMKTLLFENDASVERLRQLLELPA